MNRRVTMSVGFAGVIMLMAGVMLLPATVFSSNAVQIDPTSQQQTIDAVVGGFFTQTAQAQGQIALTQTVDAAFNNALTATASFDATAAAQFGAMMTATAQAQMTGAATENIDHPLMSMLSILPDSELIRGDSENPYTPLFYVDFYAIGRAYPEPFQIQSDADFSGRKTELWHDSMLRALGLPGDFDSETQLFEGTGNERDPITLGWTGPTVIEAMPDIVGFDYFEIEQDIDYGRPPISGTVLAVNYDPTRVQDALINRGYLAYNFDGSTVFCTSEECNGFTRDINDHKANVFSSRGGTKPPIILADGHLISAPDLQAVRLFTQTISGEIPNLSSSADYGPLARALINSQQWLSGELVQAVFFPEAMFMKSEDLTTFDSVEELREEKLYENGPPRYAIQWMDYNPLPIPEMIAFADRQDGSYKVDVFAALYPDTSTALEAQDELWQRIVSFSNEFERQTTVPIIQDRYWPDPVQVFTDKQTGKAIVLISFRSTAVSIEGRPGAPLFTTGLLLEWYHALLSSMFYPVWDITLPEWYDELIVGDLGE